MNRSRLIPGMVLSVLVTWVFLFPGADMKAAGVTMVAADLNLQVVYDRNGGPERFRSDLQDALVREIDFRGCYEHVAAVSAFDPDGVVFRVTLSAPLEEQENSLSIHESIKTRSETGQDTASYTIRLESTLELFAPGLQRPVAHTRLKKQTRYQPQFNWEDGGLQARAAILQLYVQHAVNWVCKQGKKKLRRKPVRAD